MNPSTAAATARSGMRRPPRMRCDPRTRDPSRPIAVDDALIVNGLQAAGDLGTDLADAQRVHGALL